MFTTNFINTSMLNLGTDGVLGFTIEGRNNSEEWGNAFSSAGDINNDGIADIIISSRNAGEAYVIYGRNSGFDSVFDLDNISGMGDASFIYGTGLTGGVYFGGDATGIGDFNGDGFDDLLITAPGTAASSSNVAGGRAYVVYGKSGGLGASIDVTTLDGTNGFMFESYTGPASSQGILGSAFFDNAAVTGVGDFNGDGFADIALGNQGHRQLISGLGDTVGSTLVVYGRASTPTGTLNIDAEIGTTAFYLYGIEDGLTAHTVSNAGRAIGGGGDFNGDGYDDLLIGSPSSNQDGLANQGEAYLVYGFPGSAPFPGTMAQPDGIAAIEALTPGSTAYALPGGGTINIPGGAFRMDTTSAGDDFGLSMDWAGDFNGDGLDDILISAPGETTNGNDAGAVYLFFGHTSVQALDNNLDTVNGTNGVKIIGAAADAELGYYVSSAGDFNGDGRADIIISASGVAASGDDVAAYVIYGRSSGLPAVLDLSQGLDTLEMTLGDIGFAILDTPGSIQTNVTALGDINGDGLDDIGVTETRGSLQTPQEGLAHVIFGQPSANARVFGTQQNDTLIGSAGIDNILGYIGNDTLYGGDGNDFLVGGAGDDVLSGQGGNDNLNGGDGNDTYIVDDLGDLVIEAAGQGSDVVYAHVSYVLSDHIETAVSLASGASALTGNGSDNVLISSSTTAGSTMSGAGGNDILYVQGNTAVNGDAGNDTIVLADTGNTASGGTGDDTYIVSAASNTLVESASAGTDTVYSTLAATTLSANIEILVLLGSNAAGTGNSGANTIIGNGSSNTLSGGAGGDFLIGGGGNDLIVGGTGLDVMQGSSGADIFIFNSAADFGDIIQDWISADDGLMFNAASLGFTAGQSLALGDNFVKSTAPVAVSAVASFLWDTDDTALYYDADGTGGTAAILVADLQAFTDVNVDDFIFV